MHAGKLTGKGYVARLWSLFGGGYSFTHFLRNVVMYGPGIWVSPIAICKACGWSTALSTHIAALRQELRPHGLTVGHKQEIVGGVRKQYYRIERLQNAQQLEGEA